MPEESRAVEESGTTERSTDARSADFAVICSQKAEVQPLLKHIDRQRKYSDEGLVFRGGFIDHTLRVVVVEAGFEFSRHRQAAQTVIKEHHPKWVISTGFSIGLSETIGTGDVCLANEISDVHGHDLELSLPLEGGKRVHCGKHVVMDRLMFSDSEQSKLSQSSEAEAADLSSLAVAQVCNNKTDDVPVAEFLSIRSGLSRHDEAIGEQFLKIAFGDVKELPKPPLMQWLTKLKPDPVRRDVLKRLEEISIHTNRYLLQVIRKLGEKLTDNRW